MKKVLCAVILSILISIPAYADFTGHGAGYYGRTADWDRLPGYYAGNGGELTIYDTQSTNLLLTNGAYASTTSGKGSDSGSFQTFCLEADEYAANPMQIWVSTANVDGSAGSHAYGGGTNTNSGDNLDSETAWLYTQFATGSLYNYAYSNTVNTLNRSQTAAALQRLIWAIEDEGGSDFTHSFQGVSLNSTQQELITSWENLYADAEKNGWSGIGDVRVLQCYTSNGGLAQDFLYLMTPVPVPGAILLGLLGMAVAGLKLRKFA